MKTVGERTGDARMTQEAAGGQSRGEEQPERLSGSICCTQLAGCTAGHTRRDLEHDLSKVMITGQRQQQDRNGKLKEMPCSHPPK